jgi:hypothetical protein
MIVVKLLKVERVLRCRQAVSLETHFHTCFFVLELMHMWKGQSNPIWNDGDPGPHHHMAVCSNPDKDDYRVKKQIMPWSEVSPDTSYFSKLR